MNCKIKHFLLLVFSNASASPKRLLSDFDMTTHCLQTACSSTASSYAKIVPKPTFERNLRRAKPELYRLSTYRPWRSNTHSHLSPAILSKAGFSYTGKADRVKCETCDLEIESWTTDMDPIQEHMEQRPNCPYVVSRKDFFVKKGRVNEPSCVH